MVAMVPRDSHRPEVTSRQWAILADVTGDGVLMVHVTPRQQWRRARIKALLIMQSGSGQFFCQIKMEY